MTDVKKILIEDWGLIDFQQAFLKQKQYVEEVIQGIRPETLVTCCHQPIVTLGRGTKEGDVFAWEGQTLEVNRGGRATYHGPSQLVCYPIIHLGKTKPEKETEDSPTYLTKALRPTDLHQYMQTLEEALCMVIKDQYNIEAQPRPLQQQVGVDEAAEATGVWVHGKKLASIGIAVKKWVTYHGIAINLNHDPKAFKGFHPCGFLSEQMTNLEELTGRSMDYSQFKKKFVSQLAILLLGK